MGSIFDSQPSELNTNVHNVADPSEVIIGFIDVADARELRIYIDPAKVALRPFVMDCFSYVVTLDSLDFYSYLDPVELGIAASGAQGVFSVSPPCDDCTLRGTNKRPAYWPR